jgi:hypothetical protein
VKSHTFLHAKFTRLSLRLVHRICIRSARSGGYQTINHLLERSGYTLRPTREITCGKLEVLEISYIRSGARTIYVAGILRLSGSQLNCFISSQAETNTLEYHAFLQDETKFLLLSSCIGIASRTNVLINEVYVLYVQIADSTPLFESRIPYYGSSIVVVY